MATSISYDQLVQRITGDALDKSHRFTDWTRRPLSDAQLRYAVSDVTHLRDVYLALVEDLNRRGRADWVEDEMRVLTSPETYRMEPENAWQRLKTRVRKPKELAVLIEVAAWRESEAQSRDVPRGARAQGRSDRRYRRAGADHARETAQPALAAQGLRTLALGRGHRCRGQCAGSTRDVEDAAAAGAAARPRRTASATVELLKVLLRMVSERHHVAAKVIATVDDLERIAADDPAEVPALQRLAPRTVRRQGARAQTRQARARHREGPRRDGRAPVRDVPQKWKPVLR